MVPCTKQIIILQLSLAFCFFYFFYPAQTIAGTPVASISQNLNLLEQLSRETNKNVIALLSLIKEFEKHSPLVTHEAVKIIRPSVPARITHQKDAPPLFEVRMNEEYIVNEKHDIWFRIRSEDGREGWVNEEDVQLITRHSIDEDISRAARSKPEMSSLITQIVRYKGKTDELYRTAFKIGEQIEAHWSKLSESQRGEITADYEAAGDYSERIERYYRYAVRFFSPFEGFVIGPQMAGPAGVMPGDRFRGSVSMDLGQSSYNNVNVSSEVSRRLAFEGAYKINNVTETNLSIRHQHELMQTPFTNTSVDAGISARLREDLRLRGNMGYTDYSDRAFGSNSFGQFNAGLSAAYVPTEVVNINSNFRFTNKSFSGISDNNFHGISYFTGITLTPDRKNNIVLQVQGNMQASDADYMNLNRVNPQIRYGLRADDGRSFGVVVDFDMISFAEGNNANDFRKFSTDFLWRSSKDGSILSRKLQFDSKMHPFNDRQNYLRFGYQSEKRTGSLRDNRSFTTSFSTILTYITEREDLFLTDYIDIRFDNSMIAGKGFITLNIFNRFWNNFTREDDNWTDHLLNIYFEAGPYFRNAGSGTVRFNNFKFGLIAGGNIFYNFDEEYFMRNGNSLRGGFSAGGNIRILSASISLAASYERSLIVGKETSYNPITGYVEYGDILYRFPSSLQFRIDYRQPVYRNWDLHFNTSSYNIRTGATEENSINPVAKRSNMRYFGGLVYRFAM